MSWMANKRIKELEESLAAERAVNSSLNQCLDESLEVIAASDETLTRQHAVIETLTERLTSYQQLFDDKVKPLCRETLALCGARGDPQGFIG